MNAGPVVVAMGGRSLEREISLRSGHRVERALTELGFDVLALDVQESFIDEVLARKPRFVFIAMHGRGGEDGTLQELLQTLSIPYTGSDARTSALCMDKILFKGQLHADGLPTPPFHSFTETSFTELGAAKTFPKMLQELGLPVVVKPVAQGSSIGIKFVHAPEEVPSAILGAFGYGDRVLVERHVTGRELAVTVLGPAHDPRPLPIVELHTPENFYSYEAHYTIGQVRLEAPADLEPDVRRKVEEVATGAYAALKCRDFARVDLILDADQVPQVLEINTIPGLTETGITPASAEAANMSFTALVDSIIERVA